MEALSSYAVLVSSAVVCSFAVLFKSRKCRASEAMPVIETSSQSVFARNKLIGAAILVFAFWLQVPYNHKTMAEDHLLGDDVVSATYIFSWLVGVALFGTIVSGPLADYFGHQELCAMMCFLQAVCSAMLLNPTHCMESSMFGSYVVGVTVAVIVNLVEAWFVQDLVPNGKPSRRFPHALSRIVLILTSAAIFSCLFSYFIVHTLQWKPMTLHAISLPIFLLGCYWIGYCCQEELPCHGDSDGFTTLVLGTAKFGFYRKGPIMVMTVAQTMLEVSAMVVILTSSYNVQWMRFGSNQALEYAANLATVAVGATIFQSYFSKNDVQGALNGLQLSALCLFFGTALFSASWLNFISPVWSFLGISVHLARTAVLLVHLAAGIYLPASAVVRGYLFPGRRRASILSWTRVPALLVISGVAAVITTGTSTSKILPLSPLLALMSLVAISKLQRMIQSNSPVRIAG